MTTTSTTTHPNRTFAQHAASRTNLRPRFVPLSGMSAERLAALRANAPRLDTTTNYANSPLTSNAPANQNNEE